MELGDETIMMTSCMPSVNQNTPLMLMGDMMQELEEFWLNWSPQGLLELEPATSAKFASSTFSDCEFSEKPPHVLCSLFIFICPERIWMSIRTTRCHLYQL